MHRLAALVLVAAVAVAAAAQAPADELPPYLDDRSDPAAIIRSYYNAVNRGEYARAWSYFGDRKPVADYTTFAAGYADTRAVTLVIGPVATEGAAGSVYATVPVAVTATGSDGRIEVFAGCTVTRQVQPAIQEPPFRPLEIERATLHPADAPAGTALPARCDE